jgi:hypothetical protein
MTPDPNKLTLTLHLEREDREALLVRRPEAETAPVWLPLSQIEMAPERVGRRVMVTLPCWLAEAKGLVAKPDPLQGRLF